MVKSGKEKGKGPVEQWSNGRNGGMRMARAMAIEEWEWQRGEESKENGKEDERQ